MLQGVYVALAFGWRSYLQYRRTGDTGFRFSAAAPTRDRISAGLLVAGAGLGLGGTVAAARSLESLGRTFGARELVGVTTVGVGLAGTLRAQLDMGQSWRIGVDATEETALVHRGLFRLSRNPIFTSMVLVGLGTATAVPRRSTVVGGVLLLAGVEAQVRLVEEPYLRRVQGEPYVAYRKTTGRFVPGIGRDR